MLQVDISKKRGKTEQLMLVNKGDGVISREVRIFNMTDQLMKQEQD